MIKAYKFNYDMFLDDYDYTSDKVLFEIDGFNVSYIPQIILYKEQYYAVCTKNSKLNTIGVKETEYNVIGEKHDYKYSITCPYCGSEDKNSWEYDSDSNEIECGLCGSTFFYERNVEVTYSTRPIKGTEIKEVR